MKQPAAEFAAAYRYLMRDPAHHADMLDLIAADRAQLVYAAEDGVLLCQRDADGGYPMYYATASNEDCLSRMSGMMQDFDGVLVHQPELLPMLEAITPRIEAEAYIQAAYLSEAALPVHAEGFEIRPLTQEHAQTVHENYHQVPYLEYVRSRIDAGMLGAFVDGKLAGFCGSHGLGGLGMLDVLPEYRRRGIALALECAVLNDYVKRGRVPFGHIVYGNEASMRLQERLGLTFADKPIWLVFREE